MIEQDVVQNAPTPPDNKRPWIGWVAKPLLLLLTGVLLIVALGGAQRMGWISAGGGSVSAAGGDKPSRYICPMMCTPPQSEPGRCPVCGMPLVAATGGGGNLDKLAVHIEPAARRLANIRTVRAKSIPLKRNIRAVGEIAYDEGSLATIAAYVEGRIEKLLVNYTGALVKQGDPMALVYSPDLYAAQVEFVESKRALKAAAGSSLPRVLESQRALLDGARQKLLELGMTETQVRQLDRTLQAHSRIYVAAPIGGTVIERLASEGQYIKAGQPIYRIVNLSTVWLMLKLFPDDAAHVRYGQRVEAEVQSLPGRRFSGRVAFIDPRVDPKTRTVAIRVVLPNHGGVLRPGDYATASIEVDVLPIGDSTNGADNPTTRSARNVLVVPRSAVLLAGDNSVVYVETEPGRFEIRPVVLGPMTGNQAVILRGIKPGEEVAISGNFLIDSQMQLDGNPSVIDPSRAKIKTKKKKGPLELDQIEVASLAGRAGVDLERLYEAYFQVQATLAGDQMVRAAQANALLSAARALLQAGDLSDELRSLVQVIADNAGGLQEGAIAEARLSFKPVSKAVIQLAARARGANARGPFLHFYCSMVKGGQGDWLQLSKPLANPYWGSKMLRCGKQVHQLPVAARPTQGAIR